jgi:phage-related protein
MAGRDFRTLKLEILAETKNFVAGMNAGEKKTKTFGDKLAEFGKKAGLALAAATAAVGAFAIKIAVDGVKAASDLSESVSKVGVLFGDSASKIEAFAESAAASLGQTKQQALDAASTFAIFGSSAGLAGDDLVEFSTDFTNLASDLASFNNTSPEDAIQAIGAALRGEALPLRRYGVLLDEATLRQAAFELGIISTTKQALTPQQKVLAAQEVIYKQTTAAQGDFLRTSDGLANSQRILSAQLANIRTEIGTALLPIVLKLTQIFSNNVLPVIQSVADAFSSRAGGLGEGLFEFVDGVKLFLLPIIDGAINAFNDIKGAIRENIDEFQSFFNVVKSLAPIIGTTIGAALNVVGDIAAVVINVISNVLGVISGIVNKAIDAINVIIRAVNRIPGVNIPQIGGVGSGGGGTAGATGTGFSQLSGLGQGVAGAVAGAVAAGGFDGSPVGGGSAGTGAGVGTTGVLGATSANDLVKRLTAVNDAFTDLTFQVATNGISQKAAAQQFDKLTKEFRVLEKQAEALSGTTPVAFGATPFGQSQNVTNVYVSGAVDPEGTARAVANSLNSQAARSVTALRDRVN